MNGQKVSRIRKLLDDVENEVSLLKNKVNVLRDEVQELFFNDFEEEQSAQPIPEDIDTLFIVTVTTVQLEAYIEMAAKRGRMAITEVESNTIAIAESALLTAPRSMAFCKTRIPIGFGTEEGKIQSAAAEDIDRKFMLARGVDETENLVCFLIYNGSKILHYHLYTELLCYITLQVPKYLEFHKDLVDWRDEMVGQQILNQNKEANNDAR